MTKTLVYSYSHEDEELRDRLEQGLALLRRECVLANWHDRRVLAGSDFADEIDEHFESDDVVLLLVSPSFIASNWCFDREMKVAMERHERGEAIVVPIILRPCDWHTAPFGTLKALPRDGIAITTWDNVDEAFADVVRGIRGLLT